MIRPTFKVGDKVFFKDGNYPFPHPNLATTGHYAWAKCGYVVKVSHKTWGCLYTISHPTTKGATCLFEEKDLCTGWEKIKDKWNNILRYFK